MGLGLMVFLRLVTHAVDTTSHPTVPAGWRWAVMVGDVPHDDMSHCANAGWQPDSRGAEFEGEMVAVAVAKAMRISGLDVRTEVTRLDYDPIPADGDTVAIGA